MARSPSSQEVPRSVPSVNKLASKIYGKSAPDEPQGIGKATALALAKGGAKVVINYSSDANAANELIEQLGGSDNALAIKANAGDLGDIEKMVNESVVKFGKIDILIPNAGVLLMKNLANTTEQDFDSSYAVNVKGPYFLAQVYPPHLPISLTTLIASQRKQNPICNLAPTSSSSPPPYAQPPA